MPEKNDAFFEIRRLRVKIPLARFAPACAELIRKTIILGCSVRQFNVQAVQRRKLFIARRMKEAKCPIEGGTRILFVDVRGASV